MNIKKFFSLSFAALAVLVFVFFSSSISLLTDWWWYQEVAFTEVFLTSITTKMIVGGIAGSIAALFLFVHFFIATRSKIPWFSTIPASLLGTDGPISVESSTLRKVGSALICIIAIGVGLIASTSWHDLLQFFSQVPFQLKDPLFDQDISFYVFTLPVYSLGLSLIKTVILLSLVGSTAIYILRGSLDFARIVSGVGFQALMGKKSVGNGMHTKVHDGAHIGIQKKARVHISILLCLFLVSVAGGIYLSPYQLLIGQNGPVFGAAFTEATIRVPLLRISAALYGVAALAALLYGFSGRIAPLVGVFSLTVLLSVVSALIPSLFQKLIVAPNELVKETPYIRHNIEATKRAYDLDTVEEREITANKPITTEDLKANNLTIKNVRLWDREPLLSTFSQIQEIRTYYEFASVDNDRYLINNELRQIMLSPRELATVSLPNKNWINQQLTFTHGYGVAAGPVNEVTPEGLPVLFVKDLPPKSQVKELEIERPEVYYGEIPNEYIVVKTKSKEFDYPKGEENVYATYAGMGGVEINSLLRRIVYSLRFSSLKLFLSGDITRESRILYYRNIQERVSNIVPFLMFDKDPYLVIHEGKLYWILDAYTATDRYPYSQQVQFSGRTVNYIRNSVKAVVDAYDGTVQLYQMDVDDPIMKTYARMFPRTFLPISAMPAGLAGHLRYPEDIFAVQTALYTIYHMDDPQIFYNKEDQWEIPTVALGNAAQPDDEAAVMTPRHMIMKLPGEKVEEFILMLPFTPRAKDNLSAWMVARNDGQHYGKLVVYRFPKDTLVFGPKQIIGRINQDAEVSRQISLWDQGGSQVIQGSLLVIPIEESLVYVRPLYLKADAGKIPELKRVIVAYENKIAMETTLEAGLARIFGSANAQADPSQSQVPAVPTATDVSTQDLLNQAATSYDAALRAQREGDWSTYGEEIKKLGDVLQRLRR